MRAARFHSAFLDLTGADPSKVFAQSLIEQCGDEGPKLVYNAAFENTRMHELAKRFPVLEPAPSSIILQVVDLLPIARNRYYHPNQHGRTPENLSGGNTSGPSFRMLFPSEKDDSAIAA